MIAQRRPLPAADQLEPHSVDAELGLLASILLQPTVMDEVEALAPSDFYLSPHAILFSACRDLWRQGISPDVATLSSRLLELKQFELVGGKNILRTLMEAEFTSVNALSYAAVVRQKSIARQLITASREVRSLATDEARPIAERVDSAQHLVYAIGSGRDEDRSKSIGECCGDVLDFIDQGKSQGLKGRWFGRLNDLTGGIFPGHLHVCIAETGGGKSHFGLAQALDYAASMPVLLISCEMNRDELTIRSLAQASRVDSNTITQGRCTEAERQKVIAAMEKLSQLDLHFFCRGNPTIPEIKAEIRRITRHHGRPPGLIVMDYLQYLRRGGQNRVEELDQITLDFKDLAVEFHSTVLLLSQAVRDLDKRQNKRPGKQDARGCGAIENHANRIYTLYRDFKHNPDADPTEVEIAVVKNRGGLEGLIKMTFQPAVTYFGDNDL